MTTPAPTSHYLAGPTSTDDEHREIVRGRLGPEPPSGSLAWHYWYSARLFATGVTPHQELDRRPVPDMARDAARVAGQAQSAPRARHLQAVPAFPAA